MNNFDQSSTGTNIQFNICYDTYEAQFLYNDFMNNNDQDTIIQRDDVYVIIPNAIANNPYWSKSKLAKMKKQELDSLACNVCEFNGYYEETTKQEYIDMLHDVTIEQYYENYITNTSWHNIECDFKSTGYSQGDVCKIILVGENKKLYNKEFFDHLLWDCPVTILLMVDDDEYHTSDFYEGYCYDFDHETFYQKLSEVIKDKPYHDQVINFVRQNMPKSIKYI